MMFKKIPAITNNLIINDNYKQKYNRYKKQITIDGSVDNTVKQREQELCPICLDKINNGEELDYCKRSCGNPIHVDCFKMWTKHHPAKCVYCNANWTIPTITQKYINLMS